MLKAVWLALSLIWITGCGREFRVSGFEGYVEQFESSAKAHGKDLKVEELVIEFGTPASSTADATCYQSTGATPKIIVDQKKFEAMAEGKRTALLFHEMGHCVLNREHSDGGRVNNTSCPNSVMNSYTLSDQCFTGHRDHYESELFGV